MDGLLLKEGVYCAFGRCPAQLNSSIDFSAWLEHSLLPEAASTDPRSVPFPTIFQSPKLICYPSFVIIRRRIAWLVGNWLAEDLPVETRARICSLLVHLLSNNPSTDPAIRLTAARSLGKLCGEWTFDPESFLPFLPTVVEQIEDLLATVELQDSKMRLNETLGSIIERVPEHVCSSPFARRRVPLLMPALSDLAIRPTVGRHAQFTVGLVRGESLPSFRLDYAYKNSRGLLDSSPSRVRVCTERFSRRTLASNRKHYMRRPARSFSTAVIHLTYALLLFLFGMYSSNGCVDSMRTFTSRRMRSSSGSFSFADHQ